MKTQTEAGLWVSMTPLGVPVVPELKGKQQISDAETGSATGKWAETARNLSREIASRSESAEDSSEGDAITTTFDSSRAAAAAVSVGLRRRRCGGFQSVP
jgi:hypothetical protein